jgi:hypothetical protein
MFELFLEHGAKRVSVSGAKTAEDPVVQLLCAQTRVTLDEIDLVQRRNFNEMKTYAEAGQVPPTASRMQYKFQTAFAVERCSLLAARIFKASGTSAIFNRLPFARVLADINASRQHVMCQFEGSCSSAGQGNHMAPPRLSARKRLRRTTPPTTKLRAVTLKQVAAHAGVHASTVSRALNPATRRLVADDLAKKIQARGAVFRRLLDDRRRRGRECR